MHSMMKNTTKSIFFSSYYFCSELKSLLKPQAAIPLEAIFYFPPKKTIAGREPTPHKLGFLLCSLNSMSLQQLGCETIRCVFCLVCQVYMMATIKKVQIFLLSAKSMNDSQCSKGKSQRLCNHWVEKGNIKRMSGDCHKRSAVKMQHQ